MSEKSRGEGEPTSQQEVGFRGKALEFKKDWYEGEGLTGDEYDPILDGEKLERVYGSYGLGIFKSTDGRFFFGSCNRSNQDGLIEIDAPTKEELDNLIEDKPNKYGEVWGNWEAIVKKLRKE